MYHHFLFVLQRRSRPLHFNTGTIARHERKMDSTASCNLIRADEGEPRGESGNVENADRFAAVIFVRSPTMRKVGRGL